MNRHAYTFCVLEQFYRHLKRRDIYAEASTRWRNPQAQLLEGEAWEAIKPEVLTTLGLPGDPDALLAEHASTLDAAVRQLKARGYPVREEDMARLSPFVSRHLGVHGAYSFLLPELRELRDPDAPADDEDEV